MVTIRTEEAGSAGRGAAQAGSNAHATISSLVTEKEVYDHRRDGASRLGCGAHWLTVMAQVLRGHRSARYLCTGLKTKDCLPSAPSRSALSDPLGVKEYRINFG